MADFCFTTFDGKSYILPNVPSEVLEYENYIICSDINITIVLFDKNIEGVKGPQNLMFNRKNGALVKKIVYYNSKGTWSGIVDNTGTGVYLSTNNKIVSCSKSLLPYQDLLLTYNFSIELLEEEVIAFALQPIVEEIHERENIIKSSFTEVFSILPVLIVVLISIIGIKKSISFLFSQLRKC